ncbi:MAG: rod shape-determining protein RodA [Bacteroidaceae bacterium]|nr:rod shape-determining protein RodA [Bacteroidaceae bacterium]
MATTSDNNILRSLDWITIVLYLVLLALGWMSVCGATYDFSQEGNFFDLGTRSGMQIVWIGTSILLSGAILLLDTRLFDTFANVLYLAFMVLLLVTPFVANDIHGSLSWIKIGTFSLQPAEFAKFSTALALAKLMGTYGFSLSRPRDFVAAAFLILLPMVLIVLQKETGSALVYLAFSLVLYREGMTGSLLFIGVAAVAYFVVGVRYDGDLVFGDMTSVGRLAVMLMACLFTAVLCGVYGEKGDSHGLRIAFYGMMVNGVAILVAWLTPWHFDVAWVSLAVVVASGLWLAWTAMRTRLVPYGLIALFALGSIGFYFAIDQIMDHLGDHQRIRIEVLLGLKDDPQGAGYNVSQAKIAIGSGGLEGKGFLMGTQTKLKYVPEQETDFIFCTVGEEEGFVGAAGVLVIYLLFILRLIRVAERQSEVFSRVYGYCVLSVFLFHVFINVGMVLGLTPVIGIPLPFFSYGGSSLWGFTILLFIFLKLDAVRKR